MKRAAIGSKRNNRRAEKVITAAALSAGVFTSINVTPVYGDAKTWTGTVVDATNSTNDSTTFTNLPSPGDLYKWDTSALNWSSGGVATTYAAGDDVVFTDNFNAGTLIEVNSSAQSPLSMTFTHIAGSTPTTYQFLRTGDYSNSSGSSISSSQPFGTSHTTVLTLDTGFLGKVVLRSRAGNGTGSAGTIVRSGTLEIGDGGALPNVGTNNRPNLTLDGGQFQVDVTPSNNTQPSSGQLTGNLTVLSDSTIANANNQPSRVWGGSGNGSININAGVTLKVLSLNGGTATVGLTSKLNLVGAGSGTILLEDMNTGAGTYTTLAANNNFSSGSFNFDLGTGHSTMTANFNMSIGGLYGGANTVLAGTADTVTFTVGSLSTNTTFSGDFQTGSLNKVGNGVLNLAGAVTTTGALNANSGVLALSGANGSAQNATYNAQGGTLTLDNSTASNNDRLNDATAVSLSQGNFEFIGNLAAHTNEVAGALTIAGANTVKTTDFGASGSATITFASLVRNNGIVNFNLDPNTHVRFATPPTTVGGIIGGFATTNNFQDWASLDVNNNVVAFSNYNTNADPTTWGSSDNIKMTTNSINVAASTTVNSLKLAATTGAASLGIGAGQTLTVAGGGILANSDAVIDGPGILTAGNSSNPTELDLVVPDATKTLTINSVIADNSLGGAVSLLKAGPGTLVLGASNTFTGNLAIAGGTLSVGQDGLLSPSGGLTVDLGTTFELGGFNQSVATITLINGQVTNNNPTGLHGTAATITVSNLINVQNGTISANLSGAAAFTKTTGNTVTLSGSNSYTGGTTVTAGNLNVTTSNSLPALGDATFTGGTTNISAALSLGKVTVTGGNLAGGTITSNTNYDMQGTNTAGQGVITTVLGGSVGLNKDVDSNASITLNAKNTYTGATTISEGTIATNSLADGGTFSGIGASSNDAANLVFNGATDHAYLVYDSGSAASTDRLFTIQDGANNIFIHGKGALTFSNTGAIVKTGSGTLALRGDGAGVGTFNPKLPSDLTLAKNDPDLWNLGQSNTISTLVDGNGTLSIGGNTLTVNNASFTAGSLIGTGTFFVNSNLQFAGGTITTVVADGSSTATFDKFPGNGTLTAANTFSGSVNIHGGELFVNVLADGGQASGIGQSSGIDSNLQFNDGAGTLSYVGSTVATSDRQFILNADSSGFAADGASGATLTISNTFRFENGGNTFVLAGGNTGANTFAPSMQGGGGLTKTGGGQWVLTGGSHTYSGPVNINGGTLTVSSISNGGVQPAVIYANGSNVATVSDTTGLAVGMILLNNNGQPNDHVPAGTTITAIGNGTITLSQPATQDGQADTTLALLNALGSSTNSSDHLVFGGGTLNYTGPAASTDRQFTMNGNGAIASSGAGPLVFSNTAQVNQQSSGNRTLTLSGSNSGANTFAGTLVDPSGASLGLTKAGSGRWVITATNTYSGATTVSAGTLQLMGSTAWSPALSATTAGTVLNGGRLVLDYSADTDPASTVKSILAAGASGGFQTGIIRTTNAVDTKHGIGWIDNTASKNVTVGYTYLGDANVDGKVDTSDFTAMAQHFGDTNLATPGSPIWAEGDFNYDGKINALDFNAISTNFGAATIPGAGLDAPVLGSLVPEPASLGLLALGAMGLVRRRRKA